MPRLGAWHDRACFRARAGRAYVGRPSKWGNPHRVGTPLRCESGGRKWTRKMTAADAVSFYECDIRSGDVLPFAADDVASELRGRDLVCWCRLSDPCHADALLDLANR